MNLQKVARYHRNAWHHITDISTIPISPNGNGKSKNNLDQKDKIILKLKEELIQSRGLVRTTHEEYETTYEELQANNEEILSSNEELQSVNEELETSKEELQSSNEELTTINQELEKRNTELSESQKQLKQVNEHLEEFTFTSSHDLQEPLRKIQTFSSYLMSKESNLNDYAKNYVDKINTSAARMSTLLKDLLSFSLLLNGGNKKREQVDLNKLLKNVIEDFEVIILEKKATINAISLPTIPAIAIQMNQLFHNLIGNSLKFSKEKPIINISSKEVEPEDYTTYPELIKNTHYVSITVRDNGIGFDEQYIPNMFTLFRRLNVMKEVEGTGIGLTLCKKIIEDHNGFIFATSTKGSGAKFILFLPSE